MEKHELIEKLRSNMSRDTWNNWLTTAQILELDDKKVVVGLGNLFIKEAVEKRFGSIIKETINNITGKPLEVVFKEIPISKEQKNVVNGPIIKNRPLKLSEFNPEFTFDSFVTGNSNRIAYYSTLEVCKNPGKYNPLFIFGDVGLGKTHLLHAIGNFLMENAPDLKVKYVTAEDFMNQMMDGIRASDMENFRERFRRNVDFLLIDDVQFLIGKNTVQSELFHTFNSLFNSRKQIVICSDRTPDELATFHPRLISRFEMGLVTDIQAPDKATKYLIAKKMAQMISLQLTDDVAYYLAEHVDTNLRKLRGAIMNLLLQSQISGAPVNIESAKTIVNSMIRMNANKVRLQTPQVLETVKIDTVIDLVATEFNINRKDIFSSSRKKEIALARQVLAYLFKTTMKLKTKDISEKLDKNHSTIIHSIKKIEHSLLMGNEMIKNKINNIKNKLEDEKGILTI
jgi:chromosomal replication initiator protein